MFSLHILRVGSEKTQLILLQINKMSYVLTGDRGGAVVKVLCYKSEGRWIDPSWCHWNFTLT